MGRNEKTNIPPVQTAMAMKTTASAAQKGNNGLLIAVLAVLIVAIFVIAGCIVANVISERSDPGSGSSKSEPKDPSGKEPTFDRDNGKKPGEDVSAIGDASGEERDREEQPEETEPPKPEAFYGIWCAAYETREQAEPILLDLVGNGFRAQIHLTTSWSELNPKPYYVVTAGEYASYEEAEADLLQVQSFCPGAYIKYTGYWQGP